MNLSKIRLSFLLLSLIFGSFNLSRATKTLASDRALERAIRANLPALDNIQTYYSYERVDLNGDDLDDAVVYLTGGMFCGVSGGCSIEIYQGVPDGYRGVGSYSFSVTPLVVVNSTTDGWSDIVITHYAPVGRQVSERLYQFDGTRYQSYQEGELVNTDSLSVDRVFFNTPELNRFCLSGC